MAISRAEFGLDCQLGTPRRADDKALIGRIREMGKRMGHDVFTRQSLLVRDEISAGRIQCPTLIIAGAEDRLRLPEEAQELRDAIPRASLEVVEESGHMIPLEQPEQLALLMSQWLDKVR